MAESGGISRRRHNKVDSHSITHNAHRHSMAPYFRLELKMVDGNPVVEINHDYVQKYFILSLIVSHIG